MGEEDHIPSPLWHPRALSFRLAAPRFYGRHAAMQQAASATRAVTLRQAVLPVQEPARALAAVSGEPFLYWKLRELQRFGVVDLVILGLGDPDAQDRLRNIGAGLPKPVRLFFAASWDLAHPHLDDAFLFTEAETLFAGNLAPLLAGFAAAGGALALHRAETGAPAGLWALSGTRTLPGAAYLAAVPGLAAPGFFADIRTASGRHAAIHDTGAALNRPALFLDRDGVLNHDHGYVGTRARFDWIPGALEAIRMATDAGWQVFVVTNQSGIARGLYTEDDAAALLDWIADEARRQGGTIDDTRFCPYHPAATVAAYRRASDWRKPAPGMILNLIADWRLDPARCVLVGDQSTDMEAAAAAGIAGVLFGGGDLRDCVGGIVASPAHGHGPGAGAHPAAS